MSGFSYSLKQGFSNMVRHRGHTLASVCTMVACIGLFCLSFMMMVNIYHIIRSAEDTVGVTVFFEKGTTSERIDEIRAEVESLGTVDPSRTVYTSADEAWEQMQATYFEDSPELAEGFEGDNPLADSASLEFHPYELSAQQELVDYLRSIGDVRRVNYSELTAASMTTIAHAIILIASVVIIVLLVVSAFLITNTISMSISSRREEIHIMRFIGATKAFIRRPFIVEGLMTGLIGAVIPLIIVYFVYRAAENYAFADLQILSSLFTLIPAGQIFAVLIPAAALIGIGIGLAGSGFSVRRYLKV